MKTLMKSMATMAGLFLLLLLPAVSKAQTAAGPFTIVNTTSCWVEVRWAVYCNNAGCPAASVPQTSNGFVAIAPFVGTVVIPVAIQNAAGGGTWNPWIETEVYLVTVSGQPLNITGPAPLVNSSNTAYTAGPGTIPAGNPCPTVSMLWSPTTVVIL